MKQRRLRRAALRPNLTPSLDDGGGDESLTLPLRRDRLNVVVDPGESWVGDRRAESLTILVWPDPHPAKSVPVRVVVPDTLPDTLGTCSKSVSALSAVRCCCQLGPRRARKIAPEPSKQSVGGADEDYRLYVESFRQMNWPRTQEDRP